MLRGDRGLLIDCGDANVLDLLPQLGVKKIDWVLFTHTHRDQCQGVSRLTDTGTKVAAPRGDARFLTDAQLFWDDFQLFYRYRFKPDQFKPTRNVGVDRTVTGGDSIEWEDLSVLALATPGHTVGSATYFLKLDGVKYAFTGDMIHSPGKVWNLYSFDHKYWDGGYEGIVKNLAGLDRVLAAQPDILLPSHGLLMDRPPEAVRQLKTNLEGIYTFEPLNRGAVSGAPQNRLRKISDHLYHLKYTSFILLADDGSALFYDYYAHDRENSPYHF
ncbi:MBL fold metallo-hydrolase, partial [candidate division KSB1 bacterium]